MEKYKKTQRMILEREREERIITHINRVLPNNKIFS